MANRKAWLQIHACVFLWGFTAILGRLITLSAVSLVVWRMALVAVALLVVPSVRRGLRSIERPLFLTYAGIGIVVAMHWITFYGAVKLANASVAATCLALSPVFLALIEPWIARRRFNLHEVLLGLFVVPGVALVVGGTPTSMKMGILVGSTSAIFVAIFSALNKRFIERADARTVTFIEMLTGAVFLCPIALLLPHADAALPLPDLRDAMLIVVLASVCTLLPYVMALSALRHLTAFGAQLVINLEPVYTILLAMLLFGEQRELHASFYVGVAIVLATIFIHPLITARAARQ